MLDNIKDIENIVNSNYCTGCGACAYVNNSKMLINEYGEYQPVLSEFKNNNSNISFVCPSLNLVYNEDRLSPIFNDQCDYFDEKIGLYQNIYAGYVNEGEFRTQGTSGGFATWLSVELLKMKKIDGVIHLKPQKRVKKSDPFFSYNLSSTIDEITTGAKTKYHVAELSSILKNIKSLNGRYLFIGVPCMVKALRKIQLVDEEVKNSIKYTIALVCGHLKSINWSLSLGLAVGVNPEEIDKIQYRKKGDNISAKSYIYTIHKKLKMITKDSSKVVGGKFNLGALMLPACNFCDDLVGETADITIGDAWLPKYEADKRGTNLLIVRNSIINKIIKNSMKNERVIVQDISLKETIDSQSGGFRQRREGLSLRLAQLDKIGKWYPQKRIKPNQFHQSKLRKTIYLLRFKLSMNSRETFRKALELENYNYYRNHMYLSFKLLRILEITCTISRSVRNRIKMYYYKITKYSG